VAQVLVALALPLSPEGLEVAEASRGDRGRARDEDLDVIGHDTRPVDGGAVVEAQDGRPVRRTFAVIGQPARWVEDEHAVIVQ
jgi:hypothetical protein